jgi:hypothetical protein
VRGSDISGTCGMIMGTGVSVKSAFHLIRICLAPVFGRRGRIRVIYVSRGGLRTCGIIDRHSGIDILLSPKINRSLPVLWGLGDVSIRCCVCDISFLARPREWYVAHL